MAWAFFAATSCTRSGCKAVLLWSNSAYHAVNSLEQERDTDDVHAHITILRRIADFRTDYSLLRSARLSVALIGGNARAREYTVHYARHSFSCTTATVLDVTAWERHRRGRRRGMRCLLRRFVSLSDGICGLTATAAIRCGCLPPFLLDLLSWEDPFFFTRLVVAFARMIAARLRKLSNMAFHPSAALGKKHFVVLRPRTMFYW